MQLKFGLVVLALGATSVLSYPIDGSRVEFEARDHLVKRQHHHHHHHHYYRPFDYPPQFDFIRFIKSLFRAGEHYAGFRRGYNGLVADLGARGFFDHEPVLAVRAAEHEVKDSAPADDYDVNLWTDFAQEKVLFARGFSDDHEARGSPQPPTDDSTFWTNAALKEALNPDLSVRELHDDLEARGSPQPPTDDSTFWTNAALKEALNPDLSVRGFHDEDLESRDLDGEESEIEMRDGVDELYYE